MWTEKKVRVSAPFNHSHPLHSLFLPFPSLGGKGEAVEGKKGDFEGGYTCLLSKGKGGRGEKKGKSRVEEGRVCQNLPIHLLVSLPFSPLPSSEGKERGYKGKERYSEGSSTCLLKGEKGGKSGRGKEGRRWKEEERCPCIPTLRLPYLFLPFPSFGGKGGGCGGKGKAL